MCLDGYVCVCVCSEDDSVCVYACTCVCVGVDSVCVCSQLSSGVAGCVQLCVQEPGAPVPHFPNFHRVLRVVFSCVSKNLVHLSLIFPTFIESCRLSSALCLRTRCTFPSFSLFH